VVGGLIFSQTLTLYITPVYFVYLDRLQHWFRGSVARIPGRKKRAEAEERSWKRSEALTEGGGPFSRESVSCERSLTDEPPPERFHCCRRCLARKGPSGRLVPP
jgi:hypothetical protein